MPGPAIKYDELFDFPSYLKSIEEAKNATIDLANQLNKVASRTNEVLDKLYSGAKDKKIEIVNAKDFDSLNNI
jgi:hypothetical protein